MRGLRGFFSCLLASVVRPSGALFSLILMTLVVVVADVALAQAPAGPAAPPPAWTGMVPFVFAMVVLFWITSRQQKKRQQTHKTFIEGLKRGDQVLTSGGILGRVEGITDQYITLEIADGVRVKIVKTQIAGLPSSSAEAKA